MLCVVMLSARFINGYAECHYAECHYAECHYNECRYFECRGANSKASLKIVKTDF